MKNGKRGNKKARCPLVVVSTVDTWQEIIFLGLVVP